MRPRPEDVPEKWRREGRADLADVDALDDLAELDSHCLRLARQVRRLTDPELRCCWLGRARLLARFGWAGSTLDRHRTHLRNLGALEEVERTGLTTLRRLDPRRIAEMAAQARTRRETTPPTSESSVPRKHGYPGILGTYPPANPGYPPTSESWVRGRKDREEGREEGRPPARAGPSRDSPSPRESPPEKERDAGPETERSARGGAGEATWTTRLGSDPESGRPVLVGVSEFGPFVAFPSGNGQSAEFEDLHEGDPPPEELELAEALEILKAPDVERRRISASPDARAEHRRQVMENLTVVEDGPAEGQGASDA